MLEGEDGCTVLKRLRERAGWAKVPAIAMSGMVDQASRHRAEAAGFNDYAIKPLGLEKLTSCIALLAQRAARCS
jgi:CheY-like chemotaxis protein